MSIGARTTRSNDLLTGCLFSNVVFFDAVAVFGGNPRHARVGLHGKDFRTGLYQLRRRDVIGMTALKRRSDDDLWSKASNHSRELLACCAVVDDARVRQLQVFACRDAKDRDYVVVGSTADEMLASGDRKDDGGRSKTI